MRRTRAAAAALGTLIALGCSPPPAWVPSGDNAGAPFLCGDLLEQVCGPEGLWVVGHASVLDTWEGDEGLSGRCPGDDTRFRSNGCGWFQVEIAVADALHGVPPAGPIIALGVLQGEGSGSCGSVVHPELDGPHLFLMVPGDGRYSLERAHRIVPGADDLPAVRATFGHKLGFQGGASRIETDDDSLIPLEWLRREGVRMACS